MKNKALKKRIIDISYQKGLSHIGSCLTAVDIIDEIFQIKKPDEKFVLSSGHAGLALYVILEKYKELDAEKIFDHHGVHPDRCSECRIDCSSGSLGHGLGIAVGMALDDRSKNVYVLTSDGEWAEGSIQEAMRIWQDNALDNLKIYVNNNEYGAYRASPKSIHESMLLYNPDIRINHTNMDEWPEFLQRQQAHYKVLNEAEYKACLEVLK